MRGSRAKRIVGWNDQYVYCRAGHDGSGRRSRIRLDRIGEYSVVRDAPPS